MSYIIRNAYKKIRDYNIQKAYEHAVDEMVKRGYEPTSVKEIDGKITFEVDDVEKTGFVVDEIEAKNIEEVVEKHIDAEIDQPKYKYDEDFFEMGDEKGRDIEDTDMIRPGRYVDIDALRDWVRTTKINRDEDLQDALRFDVLKIPVDLHGLWESTLDRAVDHIAFKVARKIYYVGRKPQSMTPGEWDTFIADKRPEPGTYSKNEDWGERGFPYGADYKTTEGPIDFPEDSLTTQAMHKGFKEGGWAGVKL
jgi:hypothetical protein